MSRLWLAAGAFVLACSQTETGMVSEESPHQPGAGKELIPAEWTVAEDTAETGEITTLSLQLPTARDIAGLVDDQAPRLILRCLDGRIGAFIDTGASIGEPDAAAPYTELVQIELDSAPACE